MAVINMYDVVSTAIDRKKFAIAIFIHLSKAFDSLNHEILLQKLSHYGIQGIVLKLFQNYLHNIYHYVAYNDSCSPLEKINVEFLIKKLLWRFQTWANCILDFYK